MKIKLDKIILKKDFQPRAEIDSEKIDEYTELIKEGIEFPPLDIFDLDGKYYLVDGWHRFYAYDNNEWEEIECIIHKGGEDEAFNFSRGANATHGLPRTNADKRRAVLSCLERYPEKSDYAIAKICLVHRTTVNDIRKEYLEDSSRYDSPEEPQTRLVERGGKTYIQAVSNIGKKKQNVQEDIEEAESVEEKEEIKDEDKITRFNKTNENIKWAQWSWNPVTGCKHGCTYCYARDIAMRFNGTFEPAFHLERLSAPKNTNPILDSPGGNKVFVCSMADLFGNWVPDEWIEKVLLEVKNNPQWTFIFLTKNPKKLVDFSFPNNSWVGTTVDKQARVTKAEYYMGKVKAKIKFLSCEPLLEELEFEDLSIFNWVIIGGKSKSSKESAMQPEPMWSIKLAYESLKAGCSIYFKDNWEKIQDYPKTKEA